MLNPDDPKDRAAYLKLIKKAENGDREAVEQLRKQFGDRKQLWGAYGNMMAQAEWSMLEAAFGKNELVKEAMRRKLEAVREELAGPNPTPAVRLLAERAALCWFQAHYADVVVYQAGQVSLALGDYQQKRQDRTLRRFLAAVKTLALVKRLDVPPTRAAVVNETAQRGEFLELGEGPAGG